jgi:hypothetical protein
MMLPRQTSGAVRSHSTGTWGASGIMPSDCDYDCGRWDLACKAREARCRAECPACRVACRSVQAGAVAACAANIEAGPLQIACIAAAVEAGNQCYNGCC